MGKDACCQALRPELGISHPHDGRKEPTLATCPMPSHVLCGIGTHTCTHMHTRVHIHKINAIKKCKNLCIVSIMKHFLCFLQVDLDFSLIFKPLIHFRMIFMCDERHACDLILSHVDILFF